MSYLFTFTAIALLVLFVTGVGVLFWWVRRPVSYHRSTRGPLQLFSHDRGAVWTRDEEDEAVTTAAPLTPRSGRVGQNGTAVPS